MRFVKQLLVFVIAGLVILFSGGAQVASHYCNGKVVAKSFNLKMEKCWKDNVVVPITKHPIASKQSCCDTEVSFAKSSTFEKLTKLQIASIGVHIAPQISFKGDTHQPEKSIKKLRPPPNGPSIHVWIDQFLI